MKLEMSCFGFSRRSILMVVYLFEALNLLIFLPLFRLLLPSTGILPANATEIDKNHIVFLVMISYYIAEIIAAPFIGILTDVIGRKKSLLICLAVIAVGYLFSFAGVAAGSLLIVCISRIIKGAGANLRPIAIAALSDETPTLKSRIKSIAIFSSIDGIISSVYLFNAKIEAFPSIEFSYFFFSGSLPVLVGALIILMLFFIIYIGFPEIYFSIRQKKWSSYLLKFHRIFKQPWLIRLLILYFIISITYMLIVRHKDSQFDSLIKEQRADIIISYLFFGAGWVLSSGFLLPRMIERYSIRTILKAAIIGYAFIWSFKLLSSTVIAYNAFMLIGGAIIGVLWSSALSLVSFTAPEERQGQTQSICQILFSAANIVTMYIASTTFFSHPAFSHAVAIALIAFSLIIVISLPMQATNGQ